MATDRGTALAAATQAKNGLESDSQTYLFDTLRSNAWHMADYLLNEQPAKSFSQRADGPSNPLTPEFLVLVGFADPTGSGQYYTVQDQDGRELKYTMDGGGGLPECHLLDDESDGCRIPAPETEDDLLELCRLLKFPATLPL